jgi:tetratricopeptide (TPR) repeat protein
MAPMLRLICVCLLAVVSPALALDDPDTEVARRHFEKGRTFYDSGDYRHALDEFLAARRAKAAPGLDYNIARCYDRLEEYPSAVKHYQLYLEAKSNPPDLAEIKARIATLQQRVAETNAAKQQGVEPPPKPTEVEAPILLPSALDSGSPPVVPNNDDADRARRRRNGIIAGSVVAGAVVIAGAIILGVLLRQPQAGSYTKSDLGPFTVTP